MPDAGQRAVRSLEAIGDPESIACLWRVVTGKHFLVRTSALQALERMALRRHNGLRDWAAWGHAWGVILQQRGFDRSTLPNVLADVRMAGYLIDDDQTLQTMLEERAEVWHRRRTPDPDLLRELVASLDWVKELREYRVDLLRVVLNHEPAAQEQLLAVLSAEFARPHGNVARAFIAIVLRETRYEGAMDVFASELQNGNDSFVRSVVGETLCKIGNARALEILRTSRLTPLEALAEIGDERAVPMILKRVTAAINENWLRYSDSELLETALKQSLQRLSNDVLVEVASLPDYEQSGTSYDSNNDSQRTHNRLTFTGARKIAANELARRGIKTPAGGSVRTVKLPER